MMAVHENFTASNRSTLKRPVHRCHVDNESHNRSPRNKTSDRGVLLAEAQALPPLMNIVGEGSSPSAILATAGWHRFVSHRDSCARVRGWIAGRGGGRAHHEVDNEMEHELCSERLGTTGGEMHSGLERPDRTRRVDSIAIMWYGARTFLTNRRGHTWPLLHRVREMLKAARTRPSSRHPAVHLHSGLTT